MSTFRVRLLAGTSIEGPQGPVAGAALQRHRIALIALLATASKRAMSRDKLVAYLWPDSDERRARHLLRSALHALRQALGDDSIVASGDELRMDAALVASDVDEFLDAIERQELERAVALYAGPFLDGFHLSDAPELERWIDGERMRLARLQRDALERLAERAEQRRDVPDAVEWWHRLAAADPYNSRVALGLMRSLEAAGDRAAAIRHARVHEQLLRNELGAAADPAVAAAAERLRAPALRADAGNGRVAGKLPPNGQPVPDGRPVGDHTGGEPEDGPEEDDPEEDDTPIARTREEPPPDQPTAPPAIAGRPLPDRKRRRMLIAASAIVVTCATLLGAFVNSRSRSASRISDPVRAPSSRAVAVLPFVNVGGDPEQEYFSDGLTEELIAALSRVRSLRVVARTSAFAFKGKARDIREIGQSLSVGAVLEGSVLKDGDRVRVHAQLIDATNGFHLWSESYERRVADIFDIQTELALRIAAALQSELTPAERADLERKPTESMEAHTAYLKGRYFAKKRSSGSFATAIGYFERAIAADSEYARAYAGLASTYGPMGVHGFLPPREARERMRAAVTHALKIDPDLAEARAALGNFRHTYEWDFVAAEKEYRRAIELDPDEPTAHTWYGFFLQSMERFDEAIVQRRIATVLNPMSPLEAAGLGAALVFAGQTDRALETLAGALELDSTYWQTHANIGDAHLAHREPALAMNAFEQAIAHAGKIPRPRAGLAAALARAGREPEARQILERLRAEATEAGVHAPIVATVFVALREPDAALAWLEQAFRERHPDLPQTLARPALMELRGDARFRDLRHRVGLSK